MTSRDAARVLALEALEEYRSTVKLSRLDRIIARCLGIAIRKG